MADSEIPDLTGAGPLDGSEEFHVVQTGNSRKISISDIVALLGSGADGKTVLNGTAVPTTQGVDGDFYIRTTTWQIYGPKASGTWPAGVSLTGAAGADGNTITAGTSAPSGGTDNDLYFYSGPDDLYIRSGGVWTLFAAVGSTGAAGDKSDTTRSSTASLTIGTGSKVFPFTVTSPNIGWVVGSRLRASYDSSNWMEGVVTAVSGTSVTITSDLTFGSGTYASWAIALTGEKGSTGTSSAAFSVDVKTANYASVSGDFVGNKLIRMNVASANTFTVSPSMAMHEPLAVSQMGVGQTSFVAGAGVTIISAGGALKLRTRYSAATLMEVATNTYLLSGDITV